MQFNANFSFVWGAISYFSKLHIKTSAFIKTISVFGGGLNLIMQSCGTSRKLAPLCSPPLFEWCASKKQYPKCVSFIRNQVAYLPLSCRFHLLRASKSTNYLEQKILGSYPLISHVPAISELLLIPHMYQDK